MKLEKKKELASKALGVGKNRIIFNTQRLQDIKEAITKQDIRDLVNDKAILIREVKGRKVIERKNNRRRHGSVRKKVKNTKEKYILLTRKLRSCLFELRRTDSTSKEEYLRLRKQIRAGMFKSKSHMKEHISNLK